MTLHSLAHQAVKMAKDNSPLILTALGVAGSVTTAVLSGKAAIKADGILKVENLARESDVFVPPLTVRNKVTLTWQVFVPPAISLAGTIACIICANRIGTRRAAAMAAAYSLSERALVEYKDKVIERIGMNKEQAIRDEIAQDRVDSMPVGNQEVYSTGNGDSLFLEAFTGRYFRSSIEDVKHAMNRVNKKIVDGVYASLSDFYDYLGLTHTGVSDELGWNGDHLMNIEFSTSVADNGQPCHVINYRVEPVRNYFRVH